MTGQVVQTPKRWLIALMGTLLQLALGTVYAWSFFQQPVMAVGGWSNTQAAWAFSLAIFFLGVAAAWGGVNLRRYGARKLAMTGGALFGLGYMIAAYALALKSLTLLYIGYGVVGGIGLGLGYVTPVATVAGWFPDKKGFITGMVVMGFGFGALVMAKLLAPLLLSWTAYNLVGVFFAIGLILLAVTLPAGYFMVSAPTSLTTATVATVGRSTVKSCLLSRTFLLLWLVFFFNITAGILFIGFQSPLLQELLKQQLAPGVTLDPKVVADLAAAGATLIAASSICNGVGRFFWGSLSDKIGRVQTFRWILGSQLVVFGALLVIENPVLFSICVCYILLCYGGGFGSMPAFVLDVFGAEHMAVVYGALLTAWGVGGIVGPQIAAIFQDQFAAEASVYTFLFAAGLLFAGLLITFLFEPKVVERCVKL